jgi:hypothetical protein
MLAVLPKLIQHSEIRPLDIAEQRVVNFCAAPADHTDCRMVGLPDHESLDIQTDVEHTHRVGERPDGEVVDTGSGVVGRGVQRKAAG